MPAGRPARARPLASCGPERGSLDRSTLGLPCPPAAAGVRIVSARRTEARAAPDVDELAGELGSVQPGLGDEKLGCGFRAVDSSPSIPYPPPIWCGSLPHQRLPQRWRPAGRRPDTHDRRRVVCDTGPAVRQAHLPDRGPWPRDLPRTVTGLAADVCPDPEGAESYATWMIRQPGHHRPGVRGSRCQRPLDER